MAHVKTALAAVLLVAALTARADEPAFDLDVPPQPVAQALAELTRQAGLQPLVAEAVVAGLASPGVKGRLTLREAVTRALAGTGLAFEFTGPATVAITRAPPPAKTAAGPAPQRAELEEVAVTGDRDQGYAVRSASSATKTSTPLLETPASIQVIPRAVLEDKQLTTLPDAVNGQVSGVLGRTGGGYLYDNFIIRGFTGSGFGDAYRNGLLNRQDVYDLANVEQVEILKGPAAVLYGRMEPGGLINYVTKRPLETAQRELQQQLGSDRQVRSVLDLTGPLDEERRVLYRLVGAYTGADSFRTYVTNERTFLAPGLTWRPLDALELHAEVEWKRDSFHPDMGIPALGDRPAPVPIGRSFADGPDRNRISSLLAAADWTWRPAERWTVRQRFQRMDWALKTRELVPLEVLPDGRTLERIALGGQQDVVTQGTNLEVEGAFTTLGASHRLLAGLDWFAAETVAPGGFFGLAPPIDILDPVYGQVDWAAFPADGYFYRREGWTGLYAQDQVSFAGRLHVLLGGRFDWVETGTGFSDVSMDAARALRTPRRDEQLSPRAGLLWQVQPWLSAYVSYTESFGANNGRSADNRPFPPQKGKQVEGGLKVEAPGQRLTATLSAFDLVKDNLLTEDPANPGFSILAGEATSQGLELDAAGRLTDRLSLLATYAYTHARYTRNNDGLLGKRLENSARNQGSLWATYQVHPSARLGLGGVAVGKRFGDGDNTFELPAYVRLDLMASWSGAIGPTRLTLQVNVANLLDTTTYANSDGSRGTIVPGSPRSFMGAARLAF